MTEDGLHEVGEVVGEVRQGHTFIAQGNIGEELVHSCLERTGVYHAVGAAGLDQVIQEAYHTNDHNRRHTPGLRDDVEPNHIVERGKPPVALERLEALIVVLLADPRVGGGTLPPLCHAALCHQWTRIGTFGACIFNN